MQNGRTWWHRPSQHRLRHPQQLLQLPSGCLDVPSPPSLGCCARCAHFAHCGCCARLYHFPASLLPWLNHALCLNHVLYLSCGCHAFRCWAALASWQLLSGRRCRDVSLHPRRARLPRRLRADACCCSDTGHVGCGIEIRPRHLYLRMSAWTLVLSTLGIAAEYAFLYETYHGHS